MMMKAALVVEFFEKYPVAQCQIEKARQVRRNYLKVKPLGGWCRQVRIRRSTSRPGALFPNATPLTLDHSPIPKALLPFIEQLASSPLVSVLP